MSVCLFIYFFLCWACVAAQAFSSCREWRLLSASLLGASPAVASLIVEHRLCGCGAGLPPSAACGIFLGQGPNLFVSPAWTGGFFTTELLGKPQSWVCITEACTVQFSGEGCIFKKKRARTSWMPVRHKRRGAQARRGRAQAVSVPPGKQLLLSKCEVVEFQGDVFAARL